jgi:hypothetical protein
MQTIAPLWLWLTFGGIVLASLFIDFVVLKKQGAHDIGVKEALNWSLGCPEFSVQRTVLVGRQRLHRLSRYSEHEVTRIFDRLPD